MRRLPDDLPDWMKAELKALEEMPEEDIDLSDIPEITDPDWWATARRGLFYRPVKEQITLRLDADVLDWFRANAGEGGVGYHTAINAALREHALHEVKESGVRFPANMAEIAMIAAANSGRLSKSVAGADKDRLGQAVGKSGVSRASKPPRDVRARQSSAAAPGAVTDGAPTVEPSPQRLAVAEGRVAYGGLNDAIGRLCGCGCGKTTRGGRFLPGHDVKAREAYIKAMRSSSDRNYRAEAAAYDSRVLARLGGGPCVCGCGATPKGKGSMFVPGHDSQYAKYLRDTCPL